MMKPSRFVLVRIMLATVLLAVLVPTSAVAQGTSHRVIVIFDEGRAAMARSRLAALGAHEDADLSIVHGAAMTLPSGVSLAKLRQVPGVAHAEDDALVSALRKPAPVQPSQSLPWGVDRVEADLAWDTTEGDGIRVAVVDTGIDTEHPDLVANVGGGYNAISPTKSFKDDNGHGTHVAGIIAASTNEIGVVGVAPSADLFGVKVLGRSGSGWVSDIVEGIQWAVLNDMDVINMSLGSSGYSLTFDLACQEAIDEGVVIVAAAGNSGPDDGTVEYPAKFARVIGVSAIDSADEIAWFSSRGSGVDVAAPGVSVLSTYKGSSYATLSGTSMAAPHVAGVVALVLTTPVGSDDLDQDGAWNPEEVLGRLTRTAYDLGASGADAEYGAGLVRADSAIAAY